LRSVKLIAEPWDCGPGGYQVGAFPPGWAEWNDRYRDDTRDFWRAATSAAHLSKRLTASGDVFNHLGRRPSACVNFVTAHDGFTLNDLVSYNHKHNEANGEDNRDGSNDNRSWNCDAEGPTDDAAVTSLRERQKRNLLATLLLSQGTPMLLAGDEFGRTQQGNNNAYCQDDAISWLNWNPDDNGKALTCGPCCWSYRRGCRARGACRQILAALRCHSPRLNWVRISGSHRFTSIGFSKSFVASGSSRLAVAKPLSWTWRRCNSTNL
jgi:isoamylase